MKTDHRKRYTKKVIQEAFLSLLRQKPVEKITISDVCALAEISRPTFYLHYESISALLEEIGNELIASANLPEIAALSGDDSDGIRKVIVHLIRIVEENLELYRLCVLERGMATRLPEQIADELERTIVKKWSDNGLLGGTPDRSYIVEFIQGTFNSLVGCWIGRGERRESADQLAEIIEGFLLFGLSGCVG